jgi:hypothetical protein
VVRVVNAKLCVWSSAPTQLVVDLQGSYTVTTGSLLRMPGPVRLVDSRATGRLVPAGGTTVVTVPASTGAVTAAVLNVTALGAPGAGWLIVHPCDAARPTVSNVNYGAGATVANTVHVRVPGDRRVCVYNRTAAHVVVDVFGWFTTARDGMWFQPAVPQRLLDTRAGTGGWTGTVGAGQTLTVPTGVPPDAISAFATVTAVRPAAGGWATVWSGTSATPPAVSNLNFAPSSGTIANGALTRLSAGKHLAVRSSHGGHHLLVDVSGWYVVQPFSAAPPPVVLT